MDASYRFVVIEVGGYGKQSDGGTFATSEFGIQFHNGELDLPDSMTPSGCSVRLPVVFVADEAFLHCRKT